MKINAVHVWQVSLPLNEGSYRWAGGKSVDVFDSTLLAIDTDEGITGWGEVCPLGPVYLPAYAEGVRGGIQKLGPHLLGLDPREHAVLWQVMDDQLKGHPFVKSGLDMAAWDILGKVTGLPVATLLGGITSREIPLYRAISQRPAEEMAANLRSYRDDGYRRFQLKVGGDPDEDIRRIRACRAILEPSDKLVADANTGWLPADAMRVVNAVRDLDVFIEQPCLSYDECLSIRARTTLPFVLDENIDGLEPLLRAAHDRAMDMVNIKLSKLGGLTQARLVRDLCARLGMLMIVEDSWGGDVATAAIAHAAASTPVRNLFAATDFNGYVTHSFADGAPRRMGGTMCLPDGPGLGVTPRRDELGPPAFTIA
ncbi:MAG TPA: cis-3-hydroxy-L-proline dehydratase [Geminicoccus sp.]|jgi:L-alanine-DL-glutamate epimerase-like enolase superfamily enzyme|uniref:cis-3-hydroxy-L-proline dehydratase n=1 Tax=Geminicoccus sp. TaxID=2024832 RepID=UPI002E35A767|nr:cis-3-hydroxy-L-proline dehydratase [Geminicoccus sp.]HEX2525502.1 cis-3-hydroxy-L-proline dehydratase [Geminicoccus sp.]